MKNRVLAVLAIGTLIGALGAQAQPPPGQGPMCMMGGEGGPQGCMAIGMLLKNAQWAEKAGLTGDQVKVLKEAFFKFREEKIGLEAEQELAKLKVDQLMDAVKIDEEAVMAAVEKLGQADIKNQKAAMAFKIKVISVLGKEKADKIMRAHSKMMERRAGDRDSRREQWGRRDDPRAGGFGQKPGGMEHGDKAGKDRDDQGPDDNDDSEDEPEK